MKITIPIMHCFDNNYAIGAGVAFYSMLEHADSAYEYAIYVLHSDISNDNQKKLQETVSKFGNARLTFVYMNNALCDLFESTGNKAYWTKETFYKFFAPSVLAEHDKAMIADVDVVYLGDISKNFLSFDLAENYYLAAHRSFCVKGSGLEQWFYSRYRGKFSDEEIKKLVVGGGYLIFNLRLMREHNCQYNFLQYAFSNAHRLVQVEQDVIALVCQPKIKYLPGNSVVYPYCYDMYKSDHDYVNDQYYSEDEIRFALNNPIQIHYTAMSIKPWKNRNALKGDIWWKYLTKTPFVKDV